MFYFFYFIHLLYFIFVLDVEEEPFAEIKKDVSKIIHHIDWSDDEDYMKPQLTRKAATLSSECHNISYITPTVSVLTPVTPTTPPTKVTSCLSENIENTPKTYVELKNCAVTAITPPCTKAVIDENTPVTETPKYYPIFTSPPLSNVLSE